MSQNICKVSKYLSASVPSEKAEFFFFFNLCKSVQVVFLGKSERCVCVCVLELLSSFVSAQMYFMKNLVALVTLDFGTSRNGKEKNERNLNIGQSTCN